MNLYKFLITNTDWLYRWEYF